MKKIILILFCVSVSSIWGQTPIVEYLFDELGTKSPNRGSASTASAGFQLADGSVIDLHTAGGMGISGLIGDRAFDNTGSSAMGSMGTGGKAIQTTSLETLAGLKSFTLQGWYKTQSGLLTAAARLFDKQGGSSSGGFTLSSGGPGQLSLYVNSLSVGITSTNSYSESGTWVFYAVTYDSTAVSGNVKFYKGGINTGVTQVGDALTYNQGAVLTNSSGLALGNLPNGNARPFDGYLDNMRVYGSTTDALGALSINDLETIRAADVTGHRIRKISTVTGESEKFYFHQNAWTAGADLLGFVNTSPTGTRRIFTANMNTGVCTPVTGGFSTVFFPEIAANARRVFYVGAGTSTNSRSIYATHLDTLVTQKITDLPTGWTFGSGLTISADEKTLAGSVDMGAANFVATHPQSEWVQGIYDGHWTNYIFTVNIATGSVTTILTGNDWLDHVQFSPVDSTLLMFCHEGPWNLVDRMWTMRASGASVMKVHQKIAIDEADGHEFWSPNGDTVWFDQQIPNPSEPYYHDDLYLTGHNLSTGVETRYRIPSSAWSIHYNMAPNGLFFAGDGCGSPAVVPPLDSKWIYSFVPTSNGLQINKLCNLGRHNYAVEPNVSFSPDSKWVIFTSNMSGTKQVYKVEVAAPGER